MAQISGKYVIHTTQIINWKEQGIELLIQGFKSSKSTGDPNHQQQELIKNLYEQIGQLTLERDWLKKNLSYLDLKVRCSMISRDHQLTIKQQCKLLNINRATYYYKPNNSLDENDLNIMTAIDELYSMHPYSGTRRMAKDLQNRGFNIEHKGIRRYYRIMELKAVYPKMNLSKRNQAHKVYPCLLKDLDIVYSNKVWCADITYIRLQHGFVYLVAIMDWYSRYILSWCVSITLEHDFCVEALEEAIAIYGESQIFNTDHGNQYAFNSHM